MLRLEEILPTLTDEATVTFGVEAPYGQEIAGPMKPRSVHFGRVYGSDSETGEFTTDGQVLSIFPMVHMDWNKYRPDLPPWEHVEEFVIADTYEGEVVEYIWIDTRPHSVATAGDLKTVTMHAASIHEGAEGYVIDRESVREHRRRLEDG